MRTVGARIKDARSGEVMFSVSRLGMVISLYELKLQYDICTVLEQLI